MRDPYEVLGVQRNASEEEIKTAVAGLGPATFSLTGRRYYQLSYTAINIWAEGLEPSNHLHPKQVC